MNTSAKTKINIIFGDPVAHSLSPQMHNAAYKTLGIDNEYLYIAGKVKPENLSKAIAGAKAMSFNGITCTVPHKETVISLLDSIDETAQAIGAVNTIVNDHGKLIGYNTDWLGVVGPIEKITPLKDKQVVVLGAGGAARAAVFGFKKRGAQVTILNRSLEKAMLLAREFNCEYLSLDDLKKIKTMNIILNATTVGMDGEGSPLPKKYLTSNHIIFDAIYNPFETQLLKDAKTSGAKTIHGLEMLLYQGLEQFKLYTGHDAPEDVMRKVLEDHAK